MKHYLMNPLWRCINSCSYCWVRSTVLTRPELQAAPERGLDDWRRAIERDPPDIMDIAGGEPLLLDWIPDLIRSCPTVFFGLSTNGLPIDAIRRLADMKLRNITVNVSYHPEAEQYHRLYDQRYKNAVRLLKWADYRVHVNLVDHGDNVQSAGGLGDWLTELGVMHETSPFERTDTLGELLSLGLQCEAGVNHLTIGPDGSAWPCLTALRSPYWREMRLGNWIDGELDLTRKPSPCHLNCTDFYTLTSRHVSGDVWGVNARPAEANA